jgi:molybdopterin-containing oxidoreductase family iron-sulfur binding subunit
MAVLVGKCREDCRECIAACHKEHNVPNFGNVQHGINWIASRPFEMVFPGTQAPRRPVTLRVPVLCNHCDNPPCVRVCPTKATFKRRDGIVMMDYHRCIGCRFCMAGCPYGARSMNYREPRPFIYKLNPAYPPRTIGVVEKCHFCEGRLARGLAPACVTACREKALIFGDFQNPASDLRRALEERYSIKRLPKLGTEPKIYYLL